MTISIASLQDSFQRQLREARAAGADHFIDQDTKAVIALEPATGMPGPYGMWVRSLRLERMAQDARWYRRAARAIRRLFTTWPKWPEPPRGIRGLEGDREDD